MATTKSSTATETQTVAETGGEMRAELERIDAGVRTFVKERPILALLGAVAAGYVVGRILRRRG